MSEDIAEIKVLPEFARLSCDWLLAPDHRALTYLVLGDASSASRLAMTFPQTAEILLVVWPWVASGASPPVSGHADALL